ncbi:MAG: discoidin domain-containing protein [Thermoguttaceae bacterium]|jgi:hypothetical protein|nr:discoidin domain-containing protein [Thermoguttaceae bacterium]
MRFLLTPSFVLGAMLWANGPPASAEASAGDAPTPGENACELIENDYVEQFLLYQMRVLRPQPAPAGPVPTMADALGAVNGIKDGKYGFHTHREPNPWWQVDLGGAGMQGIERVVVYNRLDYGPGIANATKLAILTSNDGRTWTERYRHDGSPIGGATENDPLVVRFTEPKVAARLVRIQLLSEAPIWHHLDEVEVYGPGDPDKNLALNRPADQSSVSQWSVHRRPRPDLSPEQRQAEEQWLAAMDARCGLSPRPAPGYVDGALLKEYGAQCAERGRAQAERLRQLGVPVCDAVEQVDAAAQRLAALPDGAPTERLLAAYRELRWAVREVVWRHPAWDVEELLFYTRRDGLIFPDVSSIGLPWVGSPGGDLHILTLDRTGQTFGMVRPLLRDRLAPGHVRGFDLHFDARRLVFGWTHSDEEFSERPVRPGHETLKRMGSGWIYELCLNADSVRRITSGRWVHDAEPAYLADGRVAFMSNRSRSSMQCNQGQHEIHPSLYACEPDGSHLERLDNNITGDYNPRLLDDGRIGYMRWEYNERSFNNPHAFWAMRPDGTYPEPVFGQHLGSPIMHTNPRNIPGSRKYMLVVAQHYNFERGILGVFDPAAGIREPTAVEPLLPWTTWRGMHGMPTTNSEQGWFADPWPLAEDLALCSYDYSPNQYQVAGFGLYLVDGSGNQELIFRDPDFSSRRPVPLRPRRRPPVLPRTCDRPPAESPPTSPLGYENRAGDGVLLLGDVMVGLDELTVETPEDAPRYLRISENLVLPYFTEVGQTVYRHAGADTENWTPKRIVGDVPLEPDGSAHFTVPADRSLYFQLLDGRGREIRRMRSWVSLKPGEVRSCTGCHEGRMTTPGPQTASLAAGRPAVAPSQRVSWGDKPVSFHRDVRPILDRRCLGCHTGLKPAADVDVADPRIAQRLQSMAAISPAMAGAEVSRVRQFGSYAAPLLKVLTTQTHAESLELTEQEWIDLQAWVDLNAPLHDRCRIVCPSVQAPYRYTPEGDVALPPAGARAVGVELDREVFEPVFAARCAGCHEQFETVFRPHWVDLHDPASSLFLRSPLAETAGGSGRCGRAVFADRQDPDFQRLLHSLRARVAAAWNNPDIALIPLVEAGCTPSIFKGSPHDTSDQPQNTFE